MVMTYMATFHLHETLISTFAVCISASFLLKLSKMLKFAFLLALVASCSCISSDPELTNSKLYNENLQLVLNTLRPYQNHIQQWTSYTTSSPVYPSQTFFTCDLCTSFINLARSLLGRPVDGVSEEEAVTLVVSACRLLDLAPKDYICDQIIQIYADQFLYIMKNKSPSYNGTEICSLLASPECDSAHPEMINWGVELEGDGVDFPALQNPNELETTKILQFTDVHLDLHYKEGMPSFCGDRMPVCCRDPEGDLPDPLPEGNSTLAGKYGHNRCAMAVDGWRALLEDAKERVTDSPFIMLTGDYTHSGVWQYSVEENGKHIKYVAESIVEVLGEHTRAIYPVVGNHEPHVINLYAPTDLWDAHPSFSLKWMYEELLNPILAKYPNLLEPEEKDRFLQAGYYEASPLEGLRLIILNTNLCHMENFWLGYSAKDPEGQLAWVVGALKKAEENKENVLIIGHVEPGSCWSHWSSLWNQIVERYRGIIRAQFYGHAHKPHMRIAFQNGTTNPISLSYVAGSALPDRMNAAYSIYDFDGARDKDSTWSVLNQQLVILNLNDSNTEMKPIMQIIDLKKDLGLDDLQPSGVWDWTRKMICNQNRVDKYLEYHHKGVDSPRYVPCSVKDSECMSDFLCGLVYSNGKDDFACLQLKKEILATKCNTTGGGDDGDSGSGGIQFSWVVTSVSLAVSMITFGRIF